MTQLRCDLVSIECRAIEEQELEPSIWRHLGRSFWEEAFFLHMAAMTPTEQQSLAMAGRGGSSKRKERRSCEHARDDIRDRCSDNIYYPEDCGYIAPDSCPPAGNTPPRTA